MADVCVPARAFLDKASRYDVIAAPATGDGVTVWLERASR